MQPPFFSVVIPAYNSALFIIDALDSVLAQTFQDYEIILVDDGSEDRAELRLRLVPYLSNIKYIEAEHKGPAGARNHGIATASGQFVAFLDSDDKWFPWHLAEMAHYLSRHPTTHLVYADAIYFGDSELAGVTCMTHNPSEGEATFEALVEEKCSVISSTVVANRQMIIDVGCFDEQFTFAEDFDLWLRIAHHGSIDYLSKVHSQRRIHAENLTADSAKSFAGQAQVLAKLMGELPLSEGLKKKIQVAIRRCTASIAMENGRKQLLAGQFTTAREEFGRANRFFRRPKLYLIMFFLKAAPEIVRYFYVRRNGVPG